jgi:MinD superfamily P-loop ATPase
MLSDMHPVYDMVENKNVEEGLNDFTEKNNIDLLITIPKKRHFLEKILETSTTRKLIYHTMVAMMCIKIKKEEKVAKTLHS